MWLNVKERVETSKNITMNIEIVKTMSKLIKRLITISKWGELDDVEQLEG